MGTTKADLILHPVRLRILTELAGRQMTPRQLGEIIADVPQATLYRQIKTLLEGGVLAVVAEQTVNGAVERTYGVVQGAGRLSVEDMRAVTREDHVRYFTIFASTLIDNFARYVQTAELDRMLDEGLSYNSVTIYLNDAEREQFRSAVIGIAEQMLANAPTPDRKGYTIASLFIPKGDQST